MKPTSAFLASAALILVLASCTSAFMVTRSGTVIGPTSFLGEQQIEELALDGPGSVHVAIKGYSTHNPDRDLTKAAKAGFLAREAAGVAKTGLNRLFDNKNITSKAQGQALLKGTKDPNVIPENPNVIPVNPNLE